jgi:hypothetical protein
VCACVSVREYVRASVRACVLVRVCACECVRASVCARVSACVYVIIVIHHAMLMRHNAICRPSGRTVIFYIITYITRLSLKKSY